MHEIPKSPMCACAFSNSKRNAKYNVFPKHDRHSHVLEEGRECEDDIPKGGGLGIPVPQARLQLRLELSVDLYNRLDVREDAFYVLRGQDRLRGSGGAPVNVGGES